MTEISRYKCDICGKMYTSANNATQCEEHHILPVRVIKPVPQDFHDGGRMPNDILVVFNDGWAYSCKICNKTPIHFDQVAKEELEQD